MPGVDSPEMAITRSSILLWSTLHQSESTHDTEAVCGSDAVPFARDTLGQQQGSEDIRDLTPAKTTLLLKVLASVDGLG